MNPRPNWLRGGILNIQAFKDDLIANLSLVGGGSFGNTLIGPNNLVQYGRVRDLLTHTEINQFIQECMTTLPIGMVLATCAQITDRSMAAAAPIARDPPPAPARLVFA